MNQVTLKNFIRNLKTYKCEFTYQVRYYIMIKFGTGHNWYLLDNLQILV